jgi:hypothetical protein
MYIKTSFFEHFKWLNAAVTKLNGEAFTNIASLLVEMRIQNRVYLLYPMFITDLNGSKVYTHQFSPEVKNFAGWKPYYDRAPPELGKKLVFKQFVEKHGLQTPAYATDQDTHLENVIIKKDISSFGDHIKGPFADTTKYQLNKNDAEFFECFTPGNIIKVWYWNEKPVVMESQAMPTITGDGKSSIKNLIEAYLVDQKIEGNIDWGQVDALLSFQNSVSDEILPERVQRLIDFRYISTFSVPANITSTRLESDAKFHEPLFKLGEAIDADLVRQGRNNTVYSVDAIQDNAGNFWFLEVNFNPAMHPCTYEDMLTSLVASDDYREIRQVAR